MIVTQVFHEQTIEQLEKVNHELIVIENSIGNFITNNIHNLEEKNYDFIENNIKEIIDEIIKKVIEMEEKLNLSV